MKRKQLTLSIVTAAALAAFGAVNAHEVSSSSGVSEDPTLSMPSDTSASSSSSIGSSEDLSASSPSTDSSTDMSSSDSMSLPHDGDVSASSGASVDSYTDEKRLEEQSLDTEGGSDQVAGYYGGYAPETSSEEVGRN